jgi:hypothetical protein
MAQLDDLIGTYFVQGTKPKIDDLQTISLVQHRNELGATLARNVFQFPDSGTPEQFMYHLLMYLLFIVCHEDCDVDAFIEYKDSPSGPQFRLKIGFFELFFTPGAFLKAILQHYLDKFYSPNDLVRLFAKHIRN